MELPPTSKGDRSKKRKDPSRITDFYRKEEDVCPVCHKGDGAVVCMGCGYLHNYHNPCLDQAITGHSFVLEWSDMLKRNFIKACHMCGKDAKSEEAKKLINKHVRVGFCNLKCMFIDVPQEPLLIQGCKTCGYFYDVHTSCLRSLYDREDATKYIVDELKSEIDACPQCISIPPALEPKKKKVRRTKEYCLICQKQCDTLKCKCCSKVWNYHSNCLRTVKENSYWYGLVLDLSGKRIQACPFCPLDLTVELEDACDSKVCIRPTDKKGHMLGCLSCDHRYVMHKQCLESSVEFNTVSGFKNIDHIAACPCCPKGRVAASEDSEDHANVVLDLTSDDEPIEHEPIDLVDHLNDPEEPSLPTVRGYLDWKEEIVYREPLPMKKRAGAVCLEGLWRDHCFLCGSESSPTSYHSWVSCVCCNYGFMMCCKCVIMLSSMSKGLDVDHSVQPYFCFWSKSFDYTPSHVCFPHAEHPGWRWYNEKNGIKGLMCFRCCKVRQDHKDPPVFDDNGALVLCP